LPRRWFRMSGVGLCRLLTEYMKARWTRCGCHRAFFQDAKTGASRYPGLGPFLARSRRRGCAVSGLSYIPPSRRRCATFKALDLIPSLYNPTSVLLIEGAVMRRQDGGAGRGARGRRQTQPSRSGGAGAPPGGIRTSCEELADGAKPLALPGQKRLGAQKGRGSAVSGSQQPPEARPGCWKTPPWRAERRGTLVTECTHTKKVAPLGAPHPRLCRGNGKRSWLAGAANNTGDDACALLFPSPRKNGEREVRSLTSCPTTPSGSTYPSACRPCPAPAHRTDRPAR
jgi:hypothetical protein